MPDDKDILIAHLKEEIMFLRDLLSRSRTPKVEAVEPITGKKIEVRIPKILDDKTGSYRDMNDEERSDYLGTLREVTGIDA